MSFEKDLKRRTSATWSVANLQPHEQAMNGMWLWKEPCAVGLCVSRDLVSIL